MSENLCLHGFPKNFFCDEVWKVNYSKHLKPKTGFLNKLFNLRLNETMFFAIEYFTLH